MTIFEGNVKITMTLNTQHPPHNTYETVLYFQKFNLFSVFLGDKQVWYWQYNTKRSSNSFNTICDAYLDAEKEVK